MQKIFTPEFLAAVKSVSSLANNGNWGAQELIRMLADDFSSAMDILLDNLIEKGDYEKRFSAECFAERLFGFQLDIATLGFMRETVPAWRAMQAAKEAAKDGEDFPDASEDDIRDYLMEAAPAFAFSYREKDAVKNLFNDIMRHFYAWSDESIDFQKEAPAAYAAMKEAFFKAFEEEA